MTRAIRRLSIGILGVGIVAACSLDTNNPEVGSIGDLKIPSPSVVVNDVMRDSLGNEARLALDVYDANGLLLANQTVSLQVLDSSIIVDQLGFVHGLKRDSIGARVIAGVSGLQTPQHRIVVSVPPQVTIRDTTASSIAFDVLKTDTASRTNWSSIPMTLTLKDANGVPAQGFIVKYEVIRSPSPSLTAGIPTAYVGDETARPTSRDTTDQLGVAARRVILRLYNVNDQALLSGTKTDSIIVRATASYAGAAIPGTPVDFVIPVSKKP